MELENNISNISDDNEKGDRQSLTKEEVILRKFFLNGKTIAMSISESDNLSELGYSNLHLRDAMIEFAKYVLALGGKVAYGGDMRQGGFTELMFEILSYYKADKKLEANERFFCHLAWPLSLNLSKTKEAELIQNVTFKKSSPPEDIGMQLVHNSFLTPNTPENLYVWSRCLTKMREEMESECDARIFIGGRQEGFKGKIPGILEEFLIALESNHPIYLVGAFGGVTKEIINGLNGSNSFFFSNETHFKSEIYREMFNTYNKTHPDNAIDYAEYFLILKEKGFKEISNRNGLTESENLRLATTPHVNEMVYLILKGLTNSFTK